MTDQWLIGLGGLCFAGLCVVCLLLTIPVIEHEIAARARRALEQVDVSAVRVVVHGRDAFLIGRVDDAGERLRAETAVARVYGVRAVNNALEVSRETAARRIDGPKPRPRR